MVKKRKELRIKHSNKAKYDYLAVQNVVDFILNNQNIQFNTINQMTVFETHRIKDLM